jgi:hypothetical protein
MVTTWDDRTLVEDLVARAVDDWLDPGIVVQIARRGTRDSDEAAFALALGLVAEALFGGLVVPGDVREGTFHPWELAPEQAYERIVREWLPLGVRDVRPGDVAWLGNTDAGRRLGEKVLRREGTLT